MVVTAEDLGWIMDTHSPGSTCGGDWPGFSALGTLSI